MARDHEDSLLQEDLGELLRLLGLPDHARPQSPHDVFQEALRVLRLWMEVYGKLRVAAAMLVNVDDERMQVAQRLITGGPSDRQLRENATLAIRDMRIALVFPA